MVCLGSQIVLRTAQIVCQALFILDGEIWADHKKPYLRSMRIKLDFMGNLLPSAGPSREKFYFPIIYFTFHFSGLGFLPQTLNKSRNSRQNRTGIVWELRVLKILEETGNRM